MVAVSRELFEKITYNNGNFLPCSSFHFWEENCRKAWISPIYLQKLLKGCAAFFLPIYVVKLLINYKKLRNKKFLWFLLLSDIRSISYGTSMGILTIGTFCLCRKLLGRIHYYSVFTIGTAAGLGLLIENKENANLNTLIYFNSFVETLMKKAHLTKFLERVFFMSISGLLMALFQMRKYPLNFFYLWFYTPPKQNKDTEVGDKCEHRSLCQDYILKEITKYFTIGYAIGIVRSLLSKFKYLTKDPSYLLTILFGIENFQFATFLGSYVGIYTAVMCCLTRFGLLDSRFRSLIAGICSGLTYNIFPQVQFLVVAITTLLQVLHNYIINELGIKNKWWHRQILFMVVQGYMFHNIALSPTDVSPYFRNMVRISTGRIFTESLERMIGPHLENYRA